MVCKTLVFHFYAFEGFKENCANRLHFSCLKYFSNVFDKSLFVISVDDISNSDLIKEAEHEIIDCGFKDVRFKVVHNDVYREGRTFKEEIADKMDKFEGLVFFGHNKGITNVMNDKMNSESILKWIAGMYYMNLHFVEEAEKKLISEFKYSLYGAYKVESPKIENKNNTWYAGTFYWLNPRRLSNNLRQRGISVPPLHDRGYAEFFSGEVDLLDSHLNMYLLPFEYNNAGNLIYTLLNFDDNELNLYYEYEKEIDI